MKGISAVTCFAILLSTSLFSVSAFLRQSPTVLTSNALRLRDVGPRQQESGGDPARSHDKDTTITTSADRVVDALNEEGFLLDMDRSIAALEQHQERLLQPSTTVAMTKEQQLTRQYKPFARLAMQAAQLNAHYDSEIREIRSSPSSSSSSSNQSSQRKSGLSSPTKALATLGCLMIGATVAVLTMNTAVDTVASPSSFADSITSAYDSLDAVVREVTSPLGETVVPKTTTTTATTEPYVLRDFSKLDIYGSSVDVEGWFSSGLY